MIHRLRLAPLLIVLGLSGACADPSPPAVGAPEGFVNKVWAVSASSSVTPGTLYVFLGEGTLVVASTQGRPMVGAWKFENGALTMVEESIPYKTDIVALTAGEFRIRSHNPGQPVEITLVPASR